MWIIYNDDLGAVAQEINKDYGVSILDGIVYFSTIIGEDKQIPVSALRGVSVENPFFN